MMNKSTSALRFFLAFALLSLGLGAPAVAELAPAEALTVGFPASNGLLFSEMVSEEAVWIADVALGVMWIMIAICLFVLALLIWVAVRYHERVNKTASRTTHSTILEVLWTGIPAIIVIVIGFFGVRQLLFLERIPALGQIEADGTYDKSLAALDINIYGLPQWNWEYEIVHFGDAQTMAAHPELFEADEDEPLDGTLKLAAGASAFRFLSNMLEHPEMQKRSLVSDVDADALLALWDQQGRELDFYQFDVDNRLVIPSGVRIRVNIQGPIDGLQHAWALPAFGVKRDFWPGHVNSAHFFLPEGSEGLYFGQCSEFCGPFHAYMPIAVHVVTMEEYRAYFATQMTAALAAAEAGSVIAPDYYPVQLPWPYKEGADTALAQQ